MADHAPVVLISGTSRGLGRYLAEHYCRSGARVIGCSRGDVELSYENYSHVRADVSKEADVRNLFSGIRRAHGRLDLLVNNAAVNPSLSLYLAVPATSVVKSFETNLLGAMLMCQAATRLMMPAGFGRLVNIGSMAQKLEVEGEAVYTAMKSALASFTRVLAKEVYRYGITCNVVAPAALPDGLSASVPAAALDTVLKRNAIPHVGAFDDVANVLDFLASRRSQAVTGQVIYLGGV
jgi:3-oxoacyl-[acyl-carrier protein] reductase